MLETNKVLIQGILNVTPDSFSDGGLYIDIDQAIEHAKKMVADGADIIDIGGESSRPGAEPVSLEEELHRVMPVVRRLIDEVNVPISIDTYKPKVAEACLQAGVHMINDIQGLRNPAMIKVISQYNIPAIIMHMPGTPQTMQQYVHYNDVVSEVKEYLRTRAEEAYARGITDIIIDPGLGFGKTPEQNYEILLRLAECKELGYPILIGPSRKSFQGEQRLNTLEALALGVKNGAAIVRVHDAAAVKKYLEHNFK